MSRSGLQAVSQLAAHVEDVCTSLTDEEWARPSGCAGWSVGDLVAHFSSNLKEVAEPSPPPAEPPAVPLLAEQAMDWLVDVRRPWGRAAVLEELTTYSGPWLAALGAVQEEPAASTPMTMSELGTYPMHQLADAFAFDLWCHLTEDLLAPHGPVQRPAPEPSALLVGSAVGWMLAGLPQMCAGPLADLEGPVGLRLTGPGGGSWVVDRGPEGVTVIEGEQPDCEVTSSATDFVRWGTRRAPWQDSCTLSGDSGRAKAFLDRVNVV